VYRPSELFSHLMNSLQDGLPLWMQSFSFRVTTGHIRHNRHFTTVLFFLVSIGRGATTSADIFSPWRCVFGFSCWPTVLKRFMNFHYISMILPSMFSENDSLWKMLNFNHYHRGFNVSCGGANIELVSAVSWSRPWQVIERISSFFYQC
jgi:hypothetical protein